MVRSNYFRYFHYSDFSKILPAKKAVFLNILLTKFIFDHFWELFGGVELLFNAVSLKCMLLPLA